MANEIWNAKANAAFILFEEIKLRKAAVEALKKFVHYEPWMDYHTDDIEVSTFKRHTFGDLRNAVKIINSDPLSASPLREPDDLLRRARQFVADAGCDEDDHDVNLARDELLAEIDAALSASPPKQP